MSLRKEFEDNVEYINGLLEDTTLSLYSKDESYIKWLENKIESRNKVDNLEGLEYTHVSLDGNAHKLSTKVTKVQGEISKDIDIDEGSIWLVAGLGHMKIETPDIIINDSLKDVIIVDRNELLRFVNEKS